MRTFARPRRVSNVRAYVKKLNVTGNEFRHGGEGIEDILNNADLEETFEKIWKSMEEEYNEGILIRRHTMFIRT